MLSVRGIYDGEKIKPLTKIPFEGRKRVLITFIDGAAQHSMPDSDIDPIRALRGCAKDSKLSQRLLESRREDAEIERAKWER
jgi:hypothetical protein